jgi:flagellar assembly protein FliH
METIRVIPREKLTSCQRWKLGSLDISETILPDNERQKATSAENQQNAANGTAAPTENNVSSLTAEKIASLFEEVKGSAHKQGYEEGYEKGLQEGRSKGYQDGKQEGQSEIKSELSQVNAIFSNLAQHLQTIDQEVAEDVLALAINLTKKMITQSLIIHPELILPVVQEAMRNLPASTQHPSLILHPEDEKIVREHLHEQLLQNGWEIREDEHLQKGGCRIETGGSEIDASIETRWRRVLASIGQKNDWVEK